MGLLSTLLTSILHPNETRALIHYAVWRDPLHNLDENQHAGMDRDTMKECWKFLDLTSRSFSRVIKELEGELARVVAIFYLVLRALDTVEDDMTLDIKLKAPLLENFYLKLEEDGWNFNGSGPNEKDRQLLVDFHVVITEYKLLAPAYQSAISSITRSMGRGMAHYATLHASSGGSFSIDTLPSFDLYCHYVAGLVGEGLSLLFSASGKEKPFIGEQKELSNSMGLMLQKTNILRDFREDVDEGRVFWPKEIWGKYATEAKELTLAENKNKALHALSEMTVDALSHATDALDYLTLLGNQSVFNFCAIPQVMAVATLDLCFRNVEVFKRNIKIRRGEAVKLILAATNPRDVAYIFRDHVRSIHKKCPSSDPSFVKLAVLAGRVEQWTESRYPSFIVLGQPTPTSSVEWKEGMDARIKQLPGLTDQQALAEERRRAIREGEKQPLTREDYKFMAILFLGVFGIIALMCGIGFAGLWFLVLREGAPFADSPEDLAKYAAEIAEESAKSIAAAAASATGHVEL
ncbi:farnesyl-diphosphate farnesyltransferase [Meredithblackwellia eburnea MCA 4105]